MAKRINQTLKIKPFAILILMTVVSFTSCEREPTYNPFDQEFDISIKQVIRNGCDTLSAGSGYFNLKGTV